MNPDKILEQTRYALESGDLSGADKLTRRILAREKHHVDALFLSGCIAYRRGNLDEAVERLRRVLDLQPDYVQAHINAGAALNELNRFDEADTHYRRALELNPGNPLALTNLGNNCICQNRLNEARELLQQAIAANPGNWLPHFALGRVFSLQQDHARAVSCRREAARLNPATTVLAALALNLNAAGETEAAYRLARDIAAREDAGDTLLQIAWLLYNACAWDVLEPLQPKLLALAGSADTREECLRHILLPLNGMTGVDNATVFAAHRNWGDKVTRFATRFSNHALRGDGPLRVGYLSADLRQHSVGLFMRHLFRHHDSRNFEIHCYADATLADRVTDEIRSAVAGFHDIAALTDTQLAAKIHADGIDILVDLSGHTDKTRIRALACRPAPVQIEYLGYPNTSGLQSIDFRITDRNAECADGTLYTEKLLYLPESFLCFGAFEQRPRATTPALDNGYITFGSFNNLRKLNPALIRVWSKLLAQVENARLLIKSAGATHAHVRDNILAEFARHDITAERIELLDFIKNSDSHLDLYNRVDIALDTFPYHGTTTTCEALWMGVPVVTLEGSSHAQRVSCSILRAIGCAETITADEAGYVARAATLAADPQALNRLRGDIPARLRDSILCDPARFTAQLENLYHDAWQRKGFSRPGANWPAWLPPQSQLEQLLREFLQLYEQRPLRDNDGGVQSVGAFSLWYYLRQVQPELVIESGVWKGFTTWLIEQTAPGAEIICFDPLPQARQYTSANASYYSSDFSEADFGDRDLSRALIYFDDHQDAFARTRQAAEKGFRHLVFDDNYAPGCGSHLSLQHVFARNGKRAGQLRDMIDAYQVFPPLYRLDTPITGEQIQVREAPLELDASDEFQQLRDDMPSYRWMTYVRLKTADAGSGPWSATPVDVPAAAPRVLACMLADRSAYRPLMFSAQEVFCGPDCKTRSDNGHYLSIATPEGLYDITEIVTQLPAHQQPELLVVKADATCRNLPVNLAALSCRKVLILGNTQHLDRPIRTLLDYAARESFDWIISDHKRQHLHYFVEAGHPRVGWLPALNVRPHPQVAAETFDYPVSFVGQAGDWHPYRAYVLNCLEDQGIEVARIQAPQHEAAAIYARSLINLNCSLNGDLNLRVFEVLSSGGFLLTDRLGKEAGLEMLFEDGEHLVCFDSPEDLAEKIRYYLAHPDEARRIARNGLAAFQRLHMPADKIRQFLQLALRGETEPGYDIALDHRCRFRSSSRHALFSRVAVYEYFQELHLNHTRLSVLFFPGSDARLLCDLADLPRIDLHVLSGFSNDPASESLLTDSGVAAQVETVSLELIGHDTRQWDAFVVRAEHLTATRIDALLMLTPVSMLVLSEPIDFVDDARYAALENALAQRGLYSSPEHPLLFLWQERARWGEILLAQGHRREAALCFESVLETDPADSIALTNLGLIAVQLGKPESAEALLVRAAHLDRRNRPALNALAGIYLDSERYDQAAPLLWSLTTLETDTAAHWNKLGLCCLQLGQIHQALTAYRQCLLLDPAAIGVAELVEQLRSLLPEQEPVPALLAPSRILVISNLFPPQELGGYGRLMADFSSLLAERGHTVRVLTSNADYLGTAPAQEPGIQRELQLFGSWENGKMQREPDDRRVVEIVEANLARLENILDEFQPQLCLLGNIDFLSNHIMTPLIQRKIPILHHMGNAVPGYVIEDTPAPAGYHLAACSGWLLDGLRARGYPLPNASVIYPGAFVEEFLMQLPAARDKLRIVFASILLPYKGAHVLLNALRQLHEAGVDFSCHIAGTTTDHAYRQELEQRVSSSRMQNKVSFVGMLDREGLKDLYARSNVLVFPSIFEEPFGISQVEAMAAGVTVISSGTGGAGEIVEHESSGVLFRSEDDADLAAALYRLVEDPDRWARIAAAGQTRALEAFNIERSVDQLETVFASMAAPARRQT